jgi:hypothetical protein
LASALYSLGFQEEALRIEVYGITDSLGGAVDAFGKVILFAKTVLPTRKITKCVKRPETFNCKTNLNERTLLVRVLNASDGNCSHAVTVHGGFIYKANKLIAIPLIIAHQHKQRRVHWLTSAELCFLLQGAAAGKD